MLLDTFSGPNSLSLYAVSSLTHRIGGGNGGGGEGGGSEGGGGEGSAAKNAKAMQPSMRSQPVAVSEQWRRTPLSHASAEV
jgi:hypothetical protein